MEAFQAFLIEKIGPASMFGADSWFQIIYWLAGAAIAVIALLALRQRTFQARAAFLLQLDRHWMDLSDTRKEIRAEYDAAVTAVLAARSSLRDPYDPQAVREDCQQRLRAMVTSDTDKYDSFIQYLGFFETVGVAVRNRYTPIKPIVQLYKGPIILIDEMFSLHIKELQAQVQMPEGLFENLIYLIKRTRKYE